MSDAPPIHVEIEIAATMDLVWDASQTPMLHQRWDLRFSTISYLPRACEHDPQHFRYTTRIGLGLEIQGEGESTGERGLSDGSRTSALRFSSSHPLSLIVNGSGYWKYIPTARGVRFLTCYNYKTRWGILGTAVDRLLFRPMIGWATAWSFDRLRRWLVDGIEPAAAARQALVHAVARVALVAIFFWHGVVPKLIGLNSDELAMVRSGGISPDIASVVVRALGLAEVLLAIALVLTWRRRWIPILLLIVMPLTLVGVALTSPRFIGAAFGPVSINGAVCALALVDILTSDGLVTAAACRRVPQ